jgi:DNA repair photolyase
LQRDSVDLNMRSGVQYWSVLRPISNPPNPWLTTEVEYLEDPPPARLEVYEDHTREILSHNDSPDLGFSWSINPYRGCFHACAYCMAGDTPILMGDGMPRPLGDVRVGDVVYGTVARGRYRRYARTKVLAHWQTVKSAFRILLEDGTSLIASGDHRFLTERGWKYVSDQPSGRRPRPHLTTGNSMLGTGAVVPPLPISRDFKRGYLCGLIRGDALLKVFRYEREGRQNGDQYQFRLALVDLEPLRRASEYLLEEGVTTRDFVFQEAFAMRRRMAGIRTHSRSRFERITDLCSWPVIPSVDWCRGFLGGIFDAEGSYSRGILRISNTDARILEEVTRCFESLGFDVVLEPGNAPARASQIRMRGGLAEHLRFFHTAAPCISRKRDIEGRAMKSPAKLRVIAVESLGIELPMYDITTGTGDFIANGVVSHNCYARPSHEYLGFGAGTDFERKITVKPEAPKLLREAFERRSWKGELIVFSGVTDCYQPLEASYRLTRGCLEVCAEYRNPVGVITKSPLIERDIDVLQALAKVADVGVTVSIPLWDREHAHAIEPQVASPQRRMQIIERLAKAGLDVGVNVAPMIPGLGDEDIARILEAAAAAGARRAGFVFLRLPGNVATVFEQRLREKLPLRADRVLARIREARGGKLYDSRWGVRGRGEGQYAEAARALFESTARRVGLATGFMGGDEPTTFRRPDRPGRQLPLL